MPYFQPNDSVSHGTMRNEDLLQSFASALESAMNEDGAKMPWHNAIAVEAFALVEAYEADADAVDDEVASDVVNSLFDALNAYAPEGCYFGAHEGDGSAYGFWSHEDDSDIEDIGA